VFVTYNIVGAVLWGAGVTTLGYYLGEIEFVKNNIEVAIIVIVALSLLPVVIELLKHRREAKRVASDIGHDVVESLDAD
jgi:membrane-associated protein